MLKPFSSLFFALALLLASLPAVGQEAEAQESGAPQLWDLRNKVAKPDLQGIARLRFVTTTDFPPFNFIDATGRLSGYHLDLARALCSVLGKQDVCQIEARPWAELQKALQDGDSDAILAGLTPTVATRAAYLFTNPFFVLPARFVAKADSDFDPASDERRKVGVVAGSAHEALLRDWFSQLETVPFADQDALFAALGQDAVNAVFGDGMRLSFWLGSEGAEQCCAFVGGAYRNPDYLGRGLSIAVSRQAPQVQAALDYGLSELARNGTLDELYRRYFPVSFF